MTLNDCGPSQEPSNFVNVWCWKEENTGVIKSGSMKGLEREYPPVISHHNEKSNMNMHIICIMCIFVYDVYYVHNNICLGKPINILFLLMLLSPFTNWPKIWSPPSLRTSTTTTEIPLWWSRSACIPRRLTAQDLPRQNLSWSFVWSSGGFLSVAPKKNEI